MGTYFLAPLAKTQFGLPHSNHHTDMYCTFLANSIQTFLSNQQIVLLDGISE